MVNNRLPPVRQRQFEIALFFGVGEALDCRFHASCMRIRTLSQILPQLR
jgi:hypothetical protein